MSTNNSAGKGGLYRDVDRTKWSQNYDRIFGKKKRQKKENDNEKRLWLREEAEMEISPAEPKSVTRPTTDNGT